VGVMETKDLQHNLCILMQDNQLYICPAGKDGKPVHRVLDAGTGTGVWAIEFGALVPYLSPTC